MKGTALMIICQVKNLTQTGAVKELTRSYEDLHLHTPSEMAFDNPSTHLMYFNTPKAHVMIYFNLNQVTNLQSLQFEEEKPEKTSNALHKVQTGKRERPNDLNPLGHYRHPLLKNNNHKAQAGTCHARHNPLPAPSQFPVGLLPTPTCPPGPGQPPAHPASCQLLASHPPARALPATCLPNQPPRSQSPPLNQSEGLIHYSQSEKSLAARPKLQNKATPSEEGKIKNSKFKNNSTTTLWESGAQDTWSEPNSIQTNIPETKIDHESNFSPIPHLAPGQPKVISSSQKLLNQTQITEEQEFGHLPKPQFPFLSSKFLELPSPAFHSQLQIFAQGEAL
ncbi:hypothetical protein DSO57_1004764 [Entomophthora muscae]|uniref:Uncharacterized protein n=1 Tax=Entomophthora muscae TaxID=34485 RepID=A0ACC2UHS9_9FUNG|nr:hypothetical protein DSO57_1004764 [Entomophthora muscae]